MGRCGGVGVKRRILGRIIIIKLDLKPVFAVFYK